VSVILAWLAQQAIFVYLACLFGALAYVLAALAAKRRRDAAQFSLERDVYQQRMSRNWLMAALFLALGGVIFLLSALFAPVLPEPAGVTPTVGVGLFTYTPVQATPTSSVPLTGTATITTVVVPGPEAPATAAPTPVPTPAPRDVYQPVCPHPEAQLTSPTAGSDLSGVVTVAGTANTRAFSYYKFEVQFPGSETPNFIAQYDTPVQNGELGQWDVSDPGRYPPGGPYRFQLVVVDIYGNTIVCTVPVDIVASNP
jgi:hypothetical protein